ncbi:DUF3794 and LysM peptidoglycan-binding domain-containing protein [Clostridium minihomine]|uniref:DUF3794 and LysM peptidoglycan-binding domain-containing protein n=1 Tax=Clostridium minihomine TaxID=2045012 RepID=UPI000C76451C|nr:DUF3794 domain-containing protein [Clostridium minihomine]
MEYTLNRQSICASEIIFDGCQEQPIDLDFSLPDYCPDIQRILKCQVCPRITSRTIMGDHLEIEGSAAIKVIYLDSGGGCIRCCENVKPFSASIQLKKQAEDAVIFTSTRVEYINCRATSPRRLDIHGAFSICAKVAEKSYQEFVKEIQGEDIQQKSQQIPTSQVTAISQQQFSVSEVLEISDSKPPANTMIRTGATACVHDYKVVTGKLILKGEVSVKLLYAPESDDMLPEAMEYVIPYSQMVDCDGLEEDHLCDVNVDVLGFDVQIKSDSSGENTLFESDIRMAANLIAYEDTEISIVTDAYSTEFELETQTQSKAVFRLVEMINDTVTQKNSFELGEGGITKVIDIWNEISSVSAEEDEDQLHFTGKLNLCILALNAQEKPFYFERVVDFSGSHEWRQKPKGVFCAPRVDVSNISFRITGSTGIEVKTELRLTAAVFQSSSYKMIADANADETRVRSKDSSAALTIYFADAGESLWEIARRYCTSIDAIKKENELEEDFAENRGMLLIPM